MKRIFTTFFLIIALAIGVFAQRTLTSGMGLKYREYSKHDDKPILVYLHGHGERGSDPSVIDKVPFSKEFVSRHKDKFTILAPQQVTAYNGWDGHPSSEHDGVRFIRWALENYKSDGRLYITGHSMGGRGTWLACTILKDRVTGFAVSAGSSEYGPTVELGKLKVPGKAFHGSNDNATNATFTQGKQAANWYKMGSGIDILKVYEGMGHGIDTKVYRDEGLAEWFLSLGKPAIPEPEPEPEPEPIVDIPGQIFLRGNQVIGKFGDKEYVLWEDNTNSQGLLYPDIAEWIASLEPGDTNGYRAYDENYKCISNCSGIHEVCAVYHLDGRQCQRCLPKQ